MKKPNILILFCGGTIVMTEGKSGALDMQAKDTAVQAILNLEPKLHEIANLEVCYIDNIDSANMNPEHWDLMTDAIAKNYDKYDGFVITHGTNTLGYTASALSYTLQNLGKPVVVTGSQIPSGRVETDGRRNFVNAVRIATMDVSGVLVVFDEEIILGSRASKVSESRLDAFETINWDDVGEIRIGIRFGRDAKPRHSQPIEVQKGFNPNIAVLNLVPGTPIDLLESTLNLGIDGLILNCYGPGDIAYAYLPILRKAKERNIPIVIRTQCLEGATMMHLNDVGQQALTAGVIQAFDMSVESTSTKLMWILAREKSLDRIKIMMHTNYTGEINKEGKIY